MRGGKSKNRMKEKLRNVDKREKNAKEQEGRMDGRRRRRVNE